jgi:hypothetical protein
MSLFVWIFLTLIVYFLDDVHNFTSNVRESLTIDTPFLPIMPMVFMLSRGP